MSDIVSKWKVFWGFAKPVSVIVLAVIGYFQDLLFDKDFSSLIFLLIGIISVVLRGKSIWAGFVAIYLAITKKG